jgi:hypothetical protein
MNLMLKKVARGALAVSIVTGVLAVTAAPSQAATATRVRRHFSLWHYSMWNLDTYCSQPVTGTQTYEQPVGGISWTPTQSFQCVLRRGVTLRMGINASGVYRWDRYSTTEYRMQVSIATSSGNYGCGEIIAPAQPSMKGFVNETFPLTNGPVGQSWGRTLDCGNGDRVTVEMFWNDAWEAI